MSPRILAIECVTQRCSVALQCDQGQIEVLTQAETDNRKASDCVLDFVSQLLIKTDIKLKNIDAITISNGPGSFMGSRLAVAVAQGLAFAHQLPIIPISTLLVLAQSAFEAYPQYKCALTAWDARMDSIYYGAYQRHNNDIQCLQHDCLQQPEQLRVDDTIDFTHAICVGNGWTTYFERLPVGLQKHAVINQDILYPQASALCTLASHYYNESAYSLPAEQVHPRYLRNQIT